MMKFFTILTEQEDTLSTIRRSILEKIPLSIYYRGPQEEVREGQRIDILPVVMGKHVKTENLVIWAFVFKGVSKRGLPGWKMFRVDRIVSCKLNPNNKTFNPNDLPDYIKGKAPNDMESLGSVEVFSPYWFEDETPTERPERPVDQIPPDAADPEEIGIEPDDEVIEPPKEESSKEVLNRVFDDLKTKINDINGKRTVTQNDFESAVRDVYKSKENEFKRYQKTISGNERPGSGTRDRFQRTSEKEINDLLKSNGIEVDNGLEQIQEIKQRFKLLINW